MKMNPGLAGVLDFEYFHMAPRIFKFILKAETGIKGWEFCAGVGNSTQRKDRVECLWL